MLKTCVMNLVLAYYNRLLDFTLEDVVCLSWNDQRTLLDLTIKNPLLVKYPVNGEFNKLFLKKVIHCLEGFEEVHDDLYSSLCIEMNKSHITTENFNFRHYLIDNDLNNILTIKETNNLVINGTTGLRTWESALLLADWVITNKEHFQNKNILELGSGVGLTGIAITKLCGVKSYQFTDYHSDVLHAICDNININYDISNKLEQGKVVSVNNNHTDIVILPLDWNTFTGSQIDIIPDIVIGADIIYDPTILKSLCKVFHNLCNINKDIVIYIANVTRNEDTIEAFFSELDTIDDLNYNELPYKNSQHITWNTAIEKKLLEIKKAVK